MHDAEKREAKKKNRELEELGLPRLPQFKEEFLRLCAKLQAD